MKEYKMSDKQLKKMLRACRPTPAMYLPGGMPMCPSPRENAEAAWRDLGRELGFDPRTVKPVPGKGQEFFTAEEV